MSMTRKDMEEVVSKMQGDAAMYYHQARRYGMDFGDDDRAIYFQLRAAWFSEQARAAYDYMIKHMSENTI
jgi:hypothetical protein